MGKDGERNPRCVHGYPGLIPLTLAYQPSSGNTEEYYESRHTPYSP